MDIRNLLGKIFGQSMEHSLSFTALTSLLVQRGIFESHPLKLLDIGCSGGISPIWRVFEPSLMALGIDPVVQECERLNAKESNSNVRYRPAFVGLPEHHPFVQKRGDREPWGGNPWNRLSANLGSKILQSKTKEKDKLSVLNDWQGSELVAPSSKIGVDALVSEEGLSTLDFIKVDVDGYDLDVILSAEETVKNSPVLGFTLEVNFYGSTDDTDHTFHNTDKLMRQWGFDLFGLSTRRYSAAALPAPFEWDGPAQTVFGRPYQGDAVYLRDPMGAGTQGAPASPDLSPHKLLKLACLFECFGLPDHAAELILSKSAKLKDLFDPQELLNVLAREVDSSIGSYSDYIDKFKADPTAFYRSKRS
ncbi:MAG: FkbM family methyltransferase [Nitrospirae bacterium]|nr:FkbM family methyltransferase [Nitrospirota bacterium]